MAGIHKFKFFQFLTDLHNNPAKLLDQRRIYQSVLKTKTKKMAADGEQPPPPPRQLTELESLQLQCNEKTDESLESTRRMKGMCEEAKDMGIKTLVLLDDQGEQLEKFEGAAEGINADMKLAEHALNSMDLLCGIFPKFWKKSGGFKEDDAIWGEENLKKVRVPEKKLVHLSILNPKNLI